MNAYDTTQTAACLALHELLRAIETIASEGHLSGPCDALTAQLDIVTDLTTRARVLNGAIQRDSVEDMGTFTRSARRALRAL